jgi:hypothetical protein
MTDIYNCDLDGSNCPYKNSDTSCPMPGVDGCYRLQDNYLSNSKVDKKDKHKQFKLEDIIRK